MKYYLDSRVRIPEEEKREDLFYFELRSGVSFNITVIEDSVLMNSEGSLVSDSDILQDAVEAGVISSRKDGIYLEGDEGAELSRIYDEWEYSTELNARDNLYHLADDISRCCHGKNAANAGIIRDLFRTSEGTEKYANMLRERLWESEEIDILSIKLMEKVIRLLGRSGISESLLTALKEDFREKIRRQHKKTDTESRNEDIPMEYWDWKDKRDFLVYNSGIVMTPDDEMELLMAGSENGNRITNFLADKYGIQELVDKEGFYQAAEYLDKSRRISRVYYDSADQENNSILIVKDGHIHRSFDDSERAFADASDFISRDKDGDFTVAKSWFIKDFFMKGKSNEAGRN